MTRQPRWRPILAVLAFVCAAGVDAARTVRCLNIPGSPKAPAPFYGMQDFRDAIYYPVVALLDGRNPYDVPDYLGRYPVGAKFPLYAPVTLAVHLPLGLLSLVHAEYVFLVVNLLLTLVLAYLALRIAGVEAGATAIFGVAALLLFSHPGHQSTFIGQSTTYVVIGVYLAILFARSSPVAAGLGLALAALKPTFGVPAAALLLVRGETRAVVTGAAVAATLSAVVAVFLVEAAGGVGPLVDSLWGNYLLWDRTFDSSAKSMFRIDALAFVGRLLGRNLTAPEDLAVMLTLFGLGVVGVRRAAAAAGARGRALSASLMCTTMLACCYHHQYDALVLSAPGIVAARSAWQRSEVLPRVAGLLLLVLIGVPAANYLSTESAVAVLGIRGPWRLAIASLNGAALLAGFFLLLGVALRASPARAAGVELERRAPRGDERRTASSS